MENHEEEYEIVQETEATVRKYKKYDIISLNQAVENVSKGNLSIYAASKKFDVPEKTISWHLRKLRSGEAAKKSGPENVLTKEEEDQLVQWILMSSEMGFPKIKDDLVQAAADIRNLRDATSTPQFKNGIPSDSWINGFLKRNPNVTFRTPESLTRAAALVSKGRIKYFFDHFYGFLERNNLLDVLNRPDAFYNLDETNFELNPKVKRVLSEKGAKNVYKVDSAKPKENITVCYCFCANGTMLRPEVILKTKFTRLEDIAYASGSVNGDFLFIQTESGWQNKASFEAYIHRLNEDLKDVPRPIFIFLDNHASHINVNLFKWCKERGIHIVSFPPNCTHILQMCDTSIFGPTKLGWKKEVNQWKRENGNKEIDEIEFIKILKAVNDKVITKSKIVNGFLGTGIYPLNFDRVHLERCIAQENNDEPSSNPIPSNPILPKVNIISNEVIVPAHGIVSGSFAEDLADISNSSDIGTSGSDDKATAISQCISKLQENIETLHSLLCEVPGDYFLNSLVIKQQLNILSTAFPVDSDAPVSSSSKSIADILKLPDPVKRTTTRRYRKVNSGVFTSNEILDMYEKDEQERLDKEKEKEERKKIREERKELQDKIKKIKKEKSESSKPAAKNKRGRPPKKSSS